MQHNHRMSEFKHNVMLYEATSYMGIITYTDPCSAIVYTIYFGKASESRYGKLHSNMNRMFTSIYHCMHSGKVTCMHAYTQVFFSRLINYKQSTFIIHPLVILSMSNNQGIHASHQQIHKYKKIEEISRDDQYKKIRQEY